jgi:SAM-dependent methyltransferase
MISEEAIWHDLECGSYDADLDCWRELADQYSGPILDVGAGNGRVSLMLAELGHEITALELDRSLLATLAERSGPFEIETICADARNFQLDRSFGLIIVPMLTVQLFGGAEGRARFFAAAARQLSANGCLALAIADLLDDEEGASGGEQLEADSCTVGSSSYSTRATALRERDGQIGIERRREIVTGDGSLVVRAATDWIDLTTADQLEAEGAAAGLAIAPRRQIPATAEYVGSVVVCLNG